MQHQLALDYDGTMVTNAWPNHGEWNPGAVEAIKALLSLSSVVVHTSRVAPVWIDGITRRSEADVQSEYNEIRRKLNAVGLDEVKIHDFRLKPWKPPAYAYVDDKAVKYRGRKNSWENLVEVLTAMHESEVRHWQKRDRSLSKP